MGEVTTIAVSLDGYKLRDDGTWESPDGNSSGKIKLLGKREPKPGLLHETGLIALVWKEREVKTDF
jgi:hypothetical protein